MMNHDDCDAGPRSEQVEQFGCRGEATRRRSDADDRKQRAPARNRDDLWQQMRHACGWLWGIGH
jgi:hypothetical protein